MRLRIEGGTARHDQPSLCLSCRYATVVRGVSLRHEIVECRRLSEPHNRVAFPVTFCNGYIDRGHPSISEMEEIAWTSNDRHVLPDESRASPGRGVSTLARIDLPAGYQRARMCHHSVRGGRNAFFE